jgi:hypothetical protein
MTLFGRCNRRLELDGSSGWKLHANFSSFLKAVQDSGMAGRCDTLCLAESARYMIQTMQLLNPLESLLTLLPRLVDIEVERWSILIPMDSIAPRLQRLCITDQSQMADHHTFFRRAKWPCMVDWDCPRMPFITKGDFDDALMSANKTLRRLNTNIKYMEQAKELVAALSGHFPQLVRLGLDGGDYHSCVGVSSLVRLTSLELRSFIGVGLVKLVVELQPLKQLRHLALPSMVWFRSDSVSDDEFKAHVAFCRDHPHMESLVARRVWNGGQRARRFLQGALEASQGRASPQGALEASCTGWRRVVDVDSMQVYLENELVRQFPRLETLGQMVMTAPTFDDAVWERARWIQPIGMSLANRPRCPNLEILEAYLPGGTVSTILLSYPRLRFLKLTGVLDREGSCSHCSRILSFSGGPEPILLAIKQLAHLNVCILHTYVWSTECLASHQDIVELVAALPRLRCLELEWTRSEEIKGAAPAMDLRFAQVTVGGMHVRYETMYSRNGTRTNVSAHGIECKSANEFACRQWFG